MLDYLVLYESETGNTKKIATQIFASLPGMSKDLININERTDFPEAKVYFIGFCVHRGTCSLNMGHFLSALSEKSIALFGTCGTGNYPDYYREIENAARIWIEDDNKYLGAFFCQGKMPLQIRQKYEELLNSSQCKDPKRLNYQIHNFDEAMIHPDKDDYIHAGRFVDSCLSKLK